MPRYAWALAMTLLLPLAARAQQVAPAPLELLLGNRQALALSEEQVASIDSLRSALAERNEPLIARFVELRARWQQGLRRPRGGGARQPGRALEVTPPARGSGNLVRAETEEIRAAAQLLLDEIQANNRAAMQGVNRLLTREQRLRLRELVQTRRPGARGGGSGAGAAPAVPGGR